MNYYLIPSEKPLKKLIKGIGVETSVKKILPLDESIVQVLDTFDNRLLGKGWLLLKEGVKGRLTTVKPGEKVYSFQIIGDNLFSWDFPKDIAQILNPILEERAVYIKGEVTYSGFQIWISDKKVSLMELRGISGVGQVSQNIRCAYAKKEDNAVISLINQLEGKKLKEHPISSMGFWKPYNPKLRFDLHSEMTSEDAIKEILSFLLGVVKINAPYIGKDVDTEFNHDFRVAIRRTRSGLSQLKRTIPKGERKTFNKRFANLASKTNTLRDLDVFLLEEQDYLDFMSKSQQKALEPLFKDIRDGRDIALKLVGEMLAGEEYSLLISDWEAFLRSPWLELSKVDPSQPIMPVAKKRIKKRYDEVVLLGNQIVTEGKDELMHDLRIECKKLRYLMEFFASLFPWDEIGYLIKQLKILQENLGNFNDLVVQKDFFDELKVGSKSKHYESDVADALAALIHIFVKEKEKVKGEFSKVYKDFSSEENKIRFRHLFN